MQLAGKNIKLFQTLQQLGDAAVLAPLRHQQVLSKPLGSLTYSNIQQLANEARASWPKQICLLHQEIFGQPLLTLLKDKGPWLRI